MIHLSKLSSDDEDIYYEVICSIIKELSSTEKGLLSAKKEKRITCLDEFFNDHYKITFKKFILSSYEELAQMKSDMEKEPQEYFEYNKTEKEKKHIFVDKIFSKFSSKPGYIEEKMGSKVNIWIAKKQGLHVCPYCNINYIYNRGKTSLGGNLDHFFSKSEYPLFSICLYNLVPSCNVCNNQKSDKPLEYSPYGEKSPFKKSFRFSYELASGNFPIERDSVKIKPTFLGSAGRNLHDDMEKTGALEAYEPFHEYAREIIMKSYVYNEMTIANLFTLNSGLFSSKEEILTMIYGNNFWGFETIEEVYKNNSLSRLTYDLLIELDIIDKK